MTRWGAIVVLAAWGSGCGNSSSGPPDAGPDAEASLGSISVCGDSISRGNNANPAVSCGFVDQLPSSWATGDDHASDFCDPGGNGIFSHAERLECETGGNVAIFNDAISGDSMVPGITGAGIGFASQARLARQQLAVAPAPRYVAVWMGHNDTNTSFVVKTGNTCGSDDRDPDNYCRSTPAAYERELRRGLDELIQVADARVLVLGLLRLSEWCGFPTMTLCDGSMTCAQYQATAPFYQSLFSDCSDQRRIDIFDTLAVYNEILDRVATEYAGIAAGDASATGAVKAAGVELQFSSAPFYLKVQPGDLSCCDCLHPGNDLQARLAGLTWHGLDCSAADTPCCGAAGNDLGDADCAVTDTTSTYPSGFWP